MIIARLLMTPKMSNRRIVNDIVKPYKSHVDLGSYDSIEGNSIDLNLSAAG